MIYKFIGKDGSMGLEKGKKYNIIFNKQDNNIFAYIEIEPYKTIVCPYNNTGLFFSNWESDNNMLNIDLGNTRGLTRNLDELGRIVIPKEFRQELNLRQKDKVEIFLLQDGIYIKKS